MNIKEAATEHCKSKHTTTRLFCTPMVVYSLPASQTLICAIRLVGKHMSQEENAEHIITMYLGGRFSPCLASSEKQQQQQQQGKQEEPQVTLTVPVDKTQAPLVSYFDTLSFADFVLWLVQRTISPSSPSQRDLIYRTLDCMVGNCMYNYISLLRYTFAYCKNQDQFLARTTEQICVKTQICMIDIYETLVGNLLEQNTTYKLALSTTTTTTMEQQDASTKQEQPFYEAHLGHSLYVCLLMKKDVELMGLALSSVSKDKPHNMWLMGTKEGACSRRPNTGQEFHDTLVFYYGIKFALNPHETSHSLLLSTSSTVIDNNAAYTVCFKL
jgi:hypothetical protein